ncbi:HAMP domain-containing sensor histidine kinase [Chryseobacterium sp.]|uniref:sensor histidine kinase n=1 Tax=Chryseobacterium sp. TaxID=1871047 RepID=UPI00289F77A4|nr:HAMP domain-containing sensor histidine kinase [Chryseobacterium sp.]
MRKILLFLFTLFYFYTIFGQQYSSAWYNTENGLPQNSIKDIVKDKYGFIGICTDGGILRYDGGNFINYKNLKINNFNFANFLGDVKSNHIVLNNSGGYQYLLIKDRKILITKKNSTALKGVTERIIFENKEYVNITKNNSHFIVAYGFIKFQKGIYLLDGKRIIYKENKTREGKKIPIHFKEEDQKNLFRFGEVLFFRDVLHKRVLQFSEGNISPINLNNSLLNDPASRVFWQDLNKQNFIINKGKIYFSELKNGKLETTPILELKNNEIDLSMIYSLLYDRENNTLYIGTLNKGLNIIKLPAFATPKVNPTVENRVQYSLLPLDSDKIINFQGRIYDKNSLLKDKHFNIVDEWCMVYDENKNILYPKKGKLYRRLAKYNYRKYDSIDIEGKQVNAITKVKNFYHLKLFDEKQNYLAIYNNGNLQKPISFFSFDTEISTTAYLNKNALLIGRDNKMYVASLTTGKVKEINTPNLSFRDIVDTEDGNFWVLTRGKGLYLFKNNTFIQMPWDEAGYLSDPNNLTKDSNGFLWISTNNGLFKVPESNLLKYAKNNQTKVFYYRYQKEDGFNSNEFNGSPNAFLKLNNGDYVVPSMDGYVFFNPLKIASYYPKSEHIYVERASLSGSGDLNFKDTLHLENNFKQASIYIDIPYYANNDNLYIETSLQNGNESGKWQRLKNRKYVLNNLSPGIYTLNIRVLVSPEGKFAYRKITIDIPFLFYQTIWFKIFIITLIIGFIVSIIVVRTRLLKTKNNQLKKIVHQKNDELKITQDQLKNEAEYQKNLIQTINHDITTPIKYLSVMSQKLSETENPKLQKQYFNTIHKSSEELYKFTLKLKNYTELFSNDTLAFQETSYFIFDILENKRRLFEEIALIKNTEIINNSSKNIALNFNESIIEAVIHNILDNAVKNTSDGKIILDVRKEEEYSIISISDSGTGMSDELLNYYNNLINSLESRTSFKNQGLGLHLVIQLLKKINGKITFNKNKTRGLLVEILIQNKG